ncbi:MAG: hypothetical protein HY699_17845 [Deltaproteobacteria bacterium]|nr:hypothetical protein [Deltaproteobacteria bacterium]
MGRWQLLRVTTVIGALWLPAQAWGLKTTLAGRALELDGYVEGREVFEENRATSHDRTQQTLRLRAAAEVTSWLRLDATTVGSNGGPTFKATKAGTFNLDDVFQDVSPAVEFEEAYLDARLDRFDLRLGKQKVAWGKLDRTQPNDLINPERFADPFLQEEDERKIGVPAVQASYYLPAADWLPQEMRFTAVWAPFYVPFRFPEVGERWFPPTLTTTQEFFIPAGLVTLPGGQPLPVPIRVPVSFRAANSRTPALRFDNGDWGVRLAGIAGEADVALYYYHGFDVQPCFGLSAEAFAHPPADPRNPLGFDITATTTLTPAFRQIDSWGADAAYPIGPFTIRAEGAYISGRPFNRDLRLLITDPRVLGPQIEQGLAAFLNGATRVPIDLGASFVTRDAVEWGMGADYSSNGYLLLLQLNQTDVLHNDAALLIKDVETRLLANVRKNFFNDDLQAQLIAVYGASSDYSVVLPRLTYRLTDALDVRLGYLFIAGRRSSVGGQYRRNDEGFVRLRYSF